MLHNYGRRPLCIISGIIMGTTLFITGLCLYLKTIGNIRIVVTSKTFFNINKSIYI